MSLSFLDVKRADSNYQFFYGNLYHLMVNAGTRVANAVQKEYGKGKRIFVACGTGNNGGDGFVAARLLSASNEVVVCAVSGRDGMKTHESLKAAGYYKGKIIEVKEAKNAMENSEIIIDALLGSGIKGDPREPYSGLIRAINSSGKTVVSVDVPSGFGSGICVSPKMTVTFTDVKEGMDADNSGKIVTADIGIPEKVFSHNGPGDFAYYRLPGRDSHKGMNGSVSLVAGWTYYGSAVIGALGAIKAGSDLVRIYSGHENRSILSSYSPDIIVRDAEDSKVLQDLAKCDSVLIGSGLGRNQAISNVIRALDGYGGTIVLDAEGLDQLDELRKKCPSAGIILTPHKGEFIRISGKEPTEENAVKFAQENKCTVLLKGVVDIITDGTRRRYTEGGNPRMTMGGTGDLLAGITSAVSTRMEDPFLAACLGSFVNKRCGDLCFVEKAYWYTIEDMINAIPEVMKTSLGISMIS